MTVPAHGEQPVATNRADSVSAVDHHRAPRPLRVNAYSNYTAAPGLTATQHQLLLAIRGHRSPEGPSIGEIAELLLLRHHSVVELVDRAEAAGLVQRTADPDQHRVVRLGLTADGAERLARLAVQHLDELAQLAPTMEALWSVLEQAGGDHDDRHPAARAPLNTRCDADHQTRAPLRAHPRNQRTTTPTIN